MESAISSGIEYQYVASFSIEGGISGYIVDFLNGTYATVPCAWVFYILSPSEQEFRPSVDISSYYVADNYSVIFRYERSLPNSYTTIYSIEYPDFICTNSTPPGIISVTVPIGSSALNVMEQAVRGYGISYRFSASYDDITGYEILQLNGFQKTDECMWVAFVTTSDEMETKLTTSVSQYTILGDNNRLTLRYMEPVLPTTVPTAATTKSSSKVKLKLYMCNIAYKYP